MRKSVRTILLAKRSGFLLDSFPAVAAFSLQSLKTGVTRVVRVRRGSDNTQQDFTANEVTDGSLAAFCGASSGFVTTWYDQSGSGFDVSQATAANQPTIYDGSSLILVNGKPSLSCSTSTLLTASVTISKINTFAVARWTGANPNNSGSISGIYATLGVVSSNDAELQISNGSSNWLGNGNNIFHNGSDVGTNAVLNLVGNNQFLVNAAIVGATNRVTLNICCASASNRGWLGQIQEVIIYGVGQTVTKSVIEANINSRYSIY